MTDTGQWQFPHARILVFGKLPQPGQVKTRLAASLGAETAAHVYAGWLERTVSTLAEAALAPVEVWLRPDTDHPLCSRLRERYGISLHAQPSGDLGQRMHQVLLHTLAWNRHAVLVGSDCPVMQPDYVQRALQALAAGIDTVIGPAEDGGYVLLGLNQVRPELFADIPWSSEQVMRRTREQMVAAARRWAELETLWDIDTPEDYRRWAAL